MNTCMFCGQAIGWQACPTGGWWEHIERPAFEHIVITTANPPKERMNAKGEWEVIEP